MENLRHHKVNNFADETVFERHLGDFADGSQGAGVAVIAHAEE